MRTNVAGTAICGRLDDESDASSSGIVGTSEALHTVLCSVDRVAPTGSTVLITGETGTGKELVARAIHRGSARSAHPFVSVNCAAIPQPLISSELFGYERGAFTGAQQRRRGRFEIAAGGTLFFDEVGELPVETQIALLRVLQEREFERVGGTLPIRADVRIVAATNCDLEAAIAAGRFRSDLYYRLNVFPIPIPPLREREEDILPLAQLFVERHARRTGKTIRGISKETVAALEEYSWPGNVRELQNVIERSMILCDSEVFSIDERWLRDGPAGCVTATSLHLVPASAPQREAIATNGTMDEIERGAITRALHASRQRIGGPNGAAAMLGLARTTLQHRMRKLGIARPPRRRRRASSPRG